MRGGWLVLGLIACGGRHEDAPAIDAPVIDAPAPDADLPDALPSDCVVGHGTTFTARRVATSTDVPVLVTSPPGDPRRFVVEQGGTIRILDGDHLVDPPFLDLSFAHGGPVRASGERGLLGLAFHPHYRENGRFFVYYTAGPGNDQHDLIVEYARADADHADPKSAHTIVDIPDFADNHNGGMLDFGADGLLYAGDGDGGGSGDPNLTAQDPTKLLGKMFRLDVDHPGAAPEIVVTGVRNPWRWSFDPATGDLYIADVGQGRYEEVDVVPRAQIGGANLGWSMYEAAVCYHPPCDPAGQLAPVAIHTHGLVSRGYEGWCAVIGGAVYHGACYPELTGRYIYTDYCAGDPDHAPLELWSFVYAGGAATDERHAPGGVPAHPTSIHADSIGELWLTAPGGVYRLEAP
jgi:glucose/arabinose dehydrogenase